MQPLKIAVCEDERFEYELLVYILEQGTLPYSCDYYSDPSELLSTFYTGKYDLIFMDIYMNDMDGLTCVRQLRRMDLFIPIAFTTTSQEHALDSYRLHVQRYLLKPLQASEIQEVCELAILQRDNRPALFFKSNGQLYRIPYDTIAFAEQQKHTILLHLTDQQVLTRSGKLDELEEDLPNQQFLRCHKSYLVNLAQVTKIDKELFIFHVGIEDTVHIKRDYIRIAAQQLDKYRFEQTRTLIP